MAENTIFSVEEVLQLEARVSAIETMINSLTQMLAVGGVNISVPELSSSITPSGTSNTSINIRNRPQGENGGVKPTPPPTNIVNDNINKNTLTITQGNTPASSILAKIPNVVGLDKNYVFTNKVGDRQDYITVKADDQTGYSFNVTLVGVPTTDIYQVDKIQSQIPLAGTFATPNSYITVNYYTYVGGSTRRMVLE